MTDFSLPDDPAMDNELKLGCWIITKGGHQGKLIAIGTSRDEWDYKIRLDDGNKTELLILDEMIDSVDKYKISLLEGIGGHHNAIGGYSCPNCHDQGCYQCLDSTQLYQ